MKDGRFPDVPALKKAPKYYYVEEGELSNYVILEQ